MALRRFFITPDQVTDDVVRLDGDLFHHVRDVCRFGPGDAFEVLTGDGQARRVEITQVGKRDLTARVTDARALPPVAKPLVILAVSIPKLPKMDWIIEKSVELGVHQIRPFTSAFSFLRQTNEVSENRLSRWRKLVTAATQQSGRGDLMDIAAPTTLDGLLTEYREAKSTAGIFAYEGQASLRLDDAVARVKRDAPDQVWTFVGSEGGFSPGEVALFAENGVPATSMGEQILRVETACLALVSVLKYELGSLR